MAWLFGTGKDKKKEPPPSAEIVISGPSSNSFQHKSHLGITEQGFEANNLPPEWKELFDGLDATLKQMGLKGITKKEAQFLLRAAAQHLPGLSSEARTALASIEKENKADKHEIVHIQGQSQSLTLSDDKETIFTRYKMLEEENKILKSEIQALKEEITKAFKTIHSIGSPAKAQPAVANPPVDSNQPIPKKDVDVNHPPVPPRDGPQHPPVPPRDGPPQPPHHDAPKAPAKMPPLPPSTTSLNTAKAAPATGNSALLDQIHKGKQLKATEIQPKSNTGGDGDILNILAKVIIERRKATEGTDEEEDNDMWD